MKTRIATCTSYTLWFCILIVLVRMLAAAPPPNHQTTRKPVGAPDLSLDHTEATVEWSLALPNDPPTIVISVTVSTFTIPGLGYEFVGNGAVGDLSVDATNASDGIRSLDVIVDTFYGDDVTYVNHRLPEETCRAYQGLMVNDPQPESDFIPLQRASAQIVGLESSSATLHIKFYGVTTVTAIAETGAGVRDTLSKTYRVYDPGQH